MKNNQLLAHLSLAFAVFALGVAVACHWWGPRAKEDVTITAGIERETSDYTEKDGVIDHPKYGTYPKEIPYQDGMTIMPGQSAIMPFEIIIEKEKEDKGI